MIVLLVYLVGLGFLFNAIGHQVNISYSQNSTGIPNSVSGGFGTLIGIGNDTAIGNIVTGIQNCPVWMNVIFIIIPVALLIFAIILLLLHG